jgi:hypothetical protein
MLKVFFDKQDIVHQEFVMVLWPTKGSARKCSLIYRSQFVRSVQKSEQTKTKCSCITLSWHTVAACDVIMWMNLLRSP